MAHQSKNIKTEKSKIKIAAIVSYRIYPAKMGGQKGIALFYKYLSRLLPVIIFSTKNNSAAEDLNAIVLPVLGNSKLRYINPFLFLNSKILSVNSNAHT